MKAILKDIYSYDIDEKLEDYTPLIADNFGFNIRLIVGEKDLGGEESIDIFLCTPLWLQDNYSKSDIIIGRSYIIVFEFNYKRILSRLKNIIENITGDDWEEIGIKLSQLGLWEFEDYQDCSQ
ncbi:Imm8 family immunity protein [Neisseria zalophi]|uniref:Uncharacterized protein n=1 Tax=Neisseria zalophi TaxID=640030 RepID=A0A5J6PTM7_9NEIS|nr:Imm8 family immunity protein [Neisseria zalophi]QEY26009.1 hypothetical protein D0T92_05320 [Neisseria zalophi]